MNQPTVCYQKSLPVTAVTGTHSRPALYCKQLPCTRSTVRKGNMHIVWAYDWYLLVPLEVRQENALPPEPPCPALQHERFSPSTQVSFKVQATDIRYPNSFESATQGSSKVLQFLAGSVIIRVHPNAERTRTALIPATCPGHFSSTTDTFLFSRMNAWTAYSSSPSRPRG